MACELSPTSRDQTRFFDLGPKYPLATARHRAEKRVNEARRNHHVHARSWPISGCVLVSVYSRLKNSHSLLKAELEECVGDLGPTLPAEHKHVPPGNGRREVAAGRGALAPLLHFLPALVLALEHSQTFIQQQHHGAIQWITNTCAIGQPKWRAMASELFMV